MALFDLPVTELERYRSPSEPPADFDRFWEETLAEARRASWPAVFTQVDNGLRLVDTFDVTFAGYGGDPIKGWLHVPRGEDALAAVVQFIGYGGGRGHAHEIHAWPLAGYAHFVMDTRGQGWKHAGHGDTPDPHGSGPAVPGLVSRGIEQPSSYYYRRLYTDAVLAIDVVRGHPRIDEARIAVTGTSQGGGVAIAAAALANGVAAAMPDLPFLCDFARGVTLTDSHPYSEIVEYLAGHRESHERVLRTLSYFDGVHFASRARAEALFSVALMDRTCPPSTVYAARNAWSASAEITSYAFNQHEGGGAAHRRVQLDWLKARFADAG